MQSSQTLLEEPVRWLRTKMGSLGMYGRGFCGRTRRDQKRLARLDRDWTEYEMTASIKISQDPAPLTSAGYLSHPFLRTDPLHLTSQARLLSPTPTLPLGRVLVARYHEADASSQAVTILLLHRTTPFKLCKHPFFLHPTYSLTPLILRCPSSSSHPVPWFSPHNDRIQS